CLLRGGFVSVLGGGVVCVCFCVAVFGVSFFAGGGCIAVCVVFSVGFFFVGVRSGVFLTVI
ncbi:hypothetical protein, partial [Erwinia amylovora]|uniref:hypothetical protein n=1 Tax=Erwinia amylovora TaxID=552 RepID=UPI0020BDBC34